MAHRVSVVEKQRWFSMSLMTIRKQASKRDVWRTVADACLQPDASTVNRIRSSAGCASASIAARKVNAGPARALAVTVAPGSTGSAIRATHRAGSAGRATCIYPARPETPGLLHGILMVVCRVRRWYRTNNRPDQYRPRYDAAVAR